MVMMMMISFKDEGTFSARIPQFIISHAVVCHLHLSNSKRQHQQQQHHRVELWKYKK